MTAVAWVGSSILLPESFSAHVEYDESTPFAALNGPRDVPLAQALHWARCRADRVFLRIGERRFSAGEEQIDDLEPWQLAENAGPTAPAGPLRAWDVMARVRWYADDGADVCRRLAAPLVADPRLTRAGVELDDEDIVARLALSAADITAAHEQAFLALSAAWEAGLADRQSSIDDFEPAYVEVHAPGHRDNQQEI